MAVGDLYQLPAVERFRHRDQVYMSTLWSAFHLLELNESCRQDASEKRFAELLSRLRQGREALWPSDVALLQQRVCGSAGHGTAVTCTFCDEVACRRGRRVRDLTLNIQI